MKASYMEAGERPLLMTPARENAPAFGRAIVEVLSTMDWGYDAAVILDWDGTHGWAGEAHDDFGVFMYVVVNSTPNGRNVLTVRHRIAIDEQFGGGVTREDVLEVVESIFETTLAELKKWSKVN